MGLRFCVFLLCLVSWIGTITQAETPQASIDRLGEPKVIVISAILGGLSHINWLLEIGQILRERGHQVYFATTEPNVKYGKYYPDIQTVSLGDHGSTQQFHDFFNAQNPFFPVVVESYVQYINDTMAKHYLAYRSVFTSTNASLVICDHLALPCLDAAHMHSLPIVVGSTMSVSQDSEAPFINSLMFSDRATTLNLSLWKRIWDQYCRFPIFAYRLIPIAKILAEARSQIGITPWDALGRHSGAIKLVNSFWGIESPRPIGPFVEHVGPVIGRHYPPLTPDLERFLDAHPRTVYIAFGQMYTPSVPEFSRILTALLESMSLGYHDGFVWSISEATWHHFAQQLTTISTNVGTFNLTSLFSGKHDHVLFVPWVPQYALLQHKHCRLFLSHGGASSVHESLYHGVPLLLHPFTSDQPATSDALTEAGVALTIDRQSSRSKDILAMLRTILHSDKEGFNQRILQIQSLVKVRARRKYYAADIIEEVLYSVRGTNDIWYRKEVVQYMPWYKANNVDIHALAVLFVALLMGLVWKTVRHLCTRSKLKIE